MTEVEKETLKKRLEEWKKDGKLEQVKTLPELLTLYKKWLYLEETEDIEITLAALLDREILRARTYV